MIFYMKYVDHVLNTCLKKNIEQYKWRWEIDLDDLTPINCAAVRDCVAKEAKEERRINREMKKINEKNNIKTNKNAKSIKK